MKHYIPLESDPEIFTKLAHRLGAPLDLEFRDVYSLDKPELLPRPALALILILPTSEAYETHVSVDDAERKEYSANDKSGTTFFKQTINNACGLYAILHAVCNVHIEDSFASETILAQILCAHQNLPPQEHARILEESAELESIYREAAFEGNSSVPESAEDDVDFHYVCFVKNSQGGVFVLDGDRKGPVETGVQLDCNDLLSKPGIDLVQAFIDREQGGNPNFSLMALVEDSSLVSKELE